MSGEIVLTQKAGLAVTKRTLRNLIVLLVLVLVVAGLNALQRTRRAEALAQELAQPDQYQAYKAMKRLAALGPGAMGRVAPLLKSEDAHVRARAAAVIAETATGRYDGSLEALLEDPDPTVRLAAVGALGAVGDQVAEAKLLAMARDEEQPMEVRIAATRSLARLASPRAATVLAGLLELPDEEDNTQLRQSAAVALSGILVEEAITELAKRLDPDTEPNAQVRALAAEGLRPAAQVGPEAVQQAGEALITALEDEASEVRLAAAYSLGQMRFSGPLNERVSEALKEARNDPHYWVRQAVAETAG